MSMHLPASMSRRRVLKSFGAGVLTAVTTPEIVAAVPDQQELTISGYCGQLSYQAGDQIELYVSTTVPEYDIEIARVGKQREIVWQQQGVAGAFHPIPDNASTHGCGWPVALTIAIAADWGSGYYSVVLRAKSHAKSAEGDAFFVLRPARPGAESRILLQLTTNTYNAYNDIGGSSLYVNGPLPLQGVRVSFDRPMALGFLSKPAPPLSSWSPYAGWHNWERPFVEWAENAGYALDYAVNLDLEFRPELLKQYSLVLSVGHDEYWSASMRDHLEGYIADGGNVAFFSGNVCYWQVRSEDQGRALVSYKFLYKKDPVFQTEDFGRLSTLWSNRLIGRPENQLTGVSFNYGGYHRFGSVPAGAGGYTVHRPEHWAFAGTNMQWGDMLGTQSSIVGYECDGCEFVLQNGLPVPTHADGTPEGFQILASAPSRLWNSDLEFASNSLLGEGATRRIERGAAVMGTYTRGGTVFTTGCTEWVRGLQAKDPLVERITRNVLDKLSATS